MMPEEDPRHTNGENVIKYGPLFELDRNKWVIRGGAQNGVTRPPLSMNMSSIFPLSSSFSRLHEWRAVRTPY